MRLFVAIFPDQKLRDYFRDLRQNLSKFKRNFKFTPIDQVHLTLKFLGNEIDEEVYNFYLENLKNNLNGFKKFDYQVSKVKFGFKFQIIPNILFAGVKPNENLEKLTDITSKSTEGLTSYEIAVRKERRKLIHHFTIGRAKPHSGRTLADSLKVKLDSIEVPNFTSEASSIYIVESRLDDKGPTYKILEEIKLS